MSFKSFVAGAACVLSLLLGGAPAKAGSCAATRLNNILGTTCTIGDKTFAFSATDFVTGITNNEIVFTPDTANPLSPGFTLSFFGDAPFGTAPTLPGTQAITSVDINYTVSVTGGSASLLGSTFTGNQAFLSLSGVTGDNAIADITNFLGNLFGASAEAFIQCSVPAGPTGCSTSTPFATTVKGTGAFATPVSSAMGQAGFELLAEGDAEALLTSANYEFNEAPLPAALPLFATGLGALGLLGWRRKRKAQAN